MDILFKRRDISDFFSEKAALAAVQYLHQKRMDACETILEKSQPSRCVHVADIITTEDAARLVS